MRNFEQQCLMTWKAVQGSSGVVRGWKGMPVTGVGLCDVRASVKFPVAMEALLVSFPKAILPPDLDLPNAVGFEVELLDVVSDGFSGIAITRKQAGSLELFADMVSSVFNAIESKKDSSEQEILAAMLKRIRMWQEFMARGDRQLGPEAELGLVGELSILNLCLDQGMDVIELFKCWVGPENSAQDFIFESGAIEVKSTMATKGFPAKIASLEQLDDSACGKLFIVGVRFEIHGSGFTLTEIIDQIRARLSTDSVARSLFDTRLMQVRYIKSHASRYTRTFLKKSHSFWRVTESFPRLIHGNVMSGVHTARYMIDLASIEPDKMLVKKVLTEVGCVCH